LARSATLLLAVALSISSLPPQAAAASGVSPYLPLHMSPEMGRQIERVLILADRPVMTRPIAAARVLEALPAACKIDQQLCRSVGKYLDRYSRRLGVTDASAQAATSSGAQVALPNQRGMTSESAWQISGNVFWQPSAYALVSLGGTAYEGDAVASGSMLSLGFEYAQLDIGYRDHWMSPFAQSAMLLSTQAMTLPSVTLSNYSPVTPLRIRYEVFLAEMEHSDRIRFNDRFTSGEPRLAGLQLSIEPAAGWSLSAHRIMQFGGGERGGNSLTDFWHALTDPRGYDNAIDITQDEEFGNQAAALSARLIVPGRVPFAAYIQYAGEDRSFEGNFRLGNAALSLGVTFPRLWQRFDLTYEVSEWQNGWYTHGIYRDGLTNDGHVLGHWGADSRRFANGVGAQAHLLRIGWEPPFGGLAQVRARTIDNQSVALTSGPLQPPGGPRTEYERAYDLTVSYSRGLHGYTVGGEVVSGSDQNGESFSRVGGFVRFGDDWAGGSGTDMSEPSDSDPVELFADAGYISYETTVTVDEFVPRPTSSGSGAHVGVGVRRAVSDRTDVGMRLELDRIDDDYMLAVRAIDYRYRLWGPLAISAFLGAARYDLATPAYGYYFGGGVMWRDVLPQFDIAIEARYADKVARDKLLPSDPVWAQRDDIFYDVKSVLLYISRKW
jgi:hypothetical protein